MTQNQAEKWMRLAIEAADESGTAYGAVVVDSEGTVIAKMGNTVKKDNDATCHAEMNVLRMSHQQMESASLNGCTLVTTVEPCSMCMGAARWGKVSNIIFGAYVKDVQASGGDQIAITSEKLNQSSPQPARLTGGVLREECVKRVKKYYNDLN